MTNLDSAASVRSQAVVTTQSGNFFTDLSDWWNKQMELLGDAADQGKIGYAPAPVLGIGAGGGLEVISAPTAPRKIDYKNYQDRVERVASGKVSKSTLSIPAEKNIVIPPSDPRDYKWNLPPHRLSLPTLPTSDPNFMPAGHKRAPVSNDYRRGRIWWKYNDETIKVQTKAAPDGEALDNNLEARRYGFQFLWNPETFGTQVAIQMDVTPDAKDRFLGAAGFFPATESVSFNIRLDRTNDFATAVNGFGRPSDMIVLGDEKKISSNYIEPSGIPDILGSNYAFGEFMGDPTMAAIKEKLSDLYRRGTLADLEFLYRAINGPGPGGTDASGKAATWINGRGIQTADIGFLMPTLLNIDIGPLSYAGFVTNLTVNHLAFTAEMIPIRTDVNISLNILATAGLSNTKEGQ